MRKTLIACGMAAVLLGAFQVPATAVEPTAPTDVQISWADVATQSVRISWQDNGEYNLVRVEYPDLPRLSQFLVAQPAGGNNEVVLKDPFVWSDKVRITVESSDSGVQSTPTPSAWFDTQRPTKPVLRDAVPQADLSLKVSWTQAAFNEVTPGDPLDLPAGESLVAQIGSLELPYPVGSTAAVIPPRKRPYPVKIVTRNEWGQSVSERAVTFATMTAGLTVAPVGVFGRSVSFDPAAEAKDCLPACSNQSGVMNLQARANTTQPWKTIGTYRPSASSERFGTLGGRYYRLSVPSWKEWSGGDSRATVTAPVTTTARYSATQARFGVVGFNKFTAQVGQVVKVTVNVQPAGTLKANLQRYDGKVWRHAGYVPLVKGTGTLNLKASGRGTTQSWRVVVPKMTYNGLPIVATPSRAFKLTVR